MAFTNEQEAELMIMLGAFQSAKRINDLDRATGSLSKMLVAVVDENGETRKMDLTEAVDTAGNPVAGRYWDETSSTPTAKGYYGSLSALKELPQKLGLGRYLVTDDRVRRKLDPADSNRFDDGSPAKLDGSMGQCMWCWNAHYFTSWKEGNNLVEVITFLPIPGKKSVYVPAGGVSWFNGGVFDSVERKLCSVISTDERYRGGNGYVLNYPDLADNAPQKTGLGMVRTYLPYGKYSLYARQRGEGWEANWFVARAVVEYSLRIILGTRNSQAPYNANLDSSGLYQGGLGPGVTNMPNWGAYNGFHPIIPTSFGVEMGDRSGVPDYSITKGDGTSVYVVPVPVFFGLVNPFGHLWSVTGGVVVDVGTEKVRGYVAPSMYAPFNNASLDGLLLAVELPHNEGYVKRYSTNLLCGLPTENSGTAATYFCDYSYVSSTAIQGFRSRLVGGSAYGGFGPGAFSTNVYGGFTAENPTVSSPLCYFEKDPVIEQ